MQDFEYAIDATTTVLVVDDELELDVDLDDPDALERVLGSTHFNVFELIELPFSRSRISLIPMPEATDALL